MFFLDFLFCNILIAVLFGFFMLIKRLCAKHMTADSRYRLWYLFILTLIFPLIPYKFAPAEFSKIHSLLSSPSSGTDIFPTNAGTGNHSLFPSVFQTSLPTWTILGLAHSICFSEFYGVSDFSSLSFISHKDFGAFTSSEEMLPSSLPKTNQICSLTIFHADRNRISGEKSPFTLPAKLKAPYLTEFYSQKSSFPKIWIFKFLQTNFALSFFTNCSITVEKTRC